MNVMKKQAKVVTSHLEQIKAKPISAQELEAQRPAMLAAWLRAVEAGKTGHKKRKGK